MAFARASCDRCGRVEVAADAVTVTVICPSGAAFFALACPHCRATLGGKCPPRMADELAQHQARLVVTRVPAEACERRDGPLFTAADVAAFGGVLDGDWVARLRHTGTAA